MKICKLHNECTVTYDRLGCLGCPVCEEIDGMKDVIDNLEEALDEYEEKKDETIKG